MANPNKSRCPSFIAVVSCLFCFACHTASSQVMAHERRVEIQSDFWISVNINGIFESIESYIRFVENNSERKISDDLLRNGIDEIVYRLDFLKKIVNLESVRIGSSYELKSDRALIDFRNNFLLKISSCVEALNGFEVLGEPEIKRMKNGLKEIEELRNLFIENKRTETKSSKRFKGQRNNEED